ncbi:MAG: hypothetical protein GMKNLPBB_01451 [Myxococcota bacterium]|nr:hypothetical protein [Myxococcota bacterium]
MKGTNWLWLALALAVSACSSDNKADPGGQTPDAGGGGTPADQDAQTPDVEGPPVEKQVEITFTPANGTMYGGESITFKADRPIFKDAEKPRGPDTFIPHIFIGENRVIFKEYVDDFTVKAVSQGHPAPSLDNAQPFEVPVRVEMRNRKDEILVTHNAKGKFSFAPPVHPSFNRIMAFGASFTAGFQSNSWNPVAQNHGPINQVARAAGAYLSTPFTTREGLPGIPKLEELDRRSGSLEVGLGAAVGTLTPALNKNEFSPLRADPYIRPLNIAIPGSTIRDVVDGSLGAGVYILDLFIQHPFEKISSRVKPKSMIENIEDYKPLLVFTTVDNYGNDVLWGGTPTDFIEDKLREMYTRVSKVETRPFLFILTVPDINMLPGRRFNQAKRYEVMRANAALKRVAKEVNATLPEPRIYVGDFMELFFRFTEAKEGDAIEFGGLNVRIVKGANGESDIVVKDSMGRDNVIGLDRFEGVFSWDDLHLSNFGYGMLGNEVIRLVNRAVGPKGEQPRLKEELSFIDLAKVLSEDYLSPVNQEAERQKLSDFPPFPTYADKTALPGLSLADRCALGMVETEMGIPKDKWADAGCPVEIRIEAEKTELEPEASAGFTATVLDGKGQPIKDLPVTSYVYRANRENGSTQWNDIRNTDENGKITNKATMGYLGDLVVHVMAGGVIQKLVIKKK